MNKTLALAAIAVAGLAFGGQTATATSASGLSFGTPVLVGAQVASEPSISVAPDKSLYITAPIGVGVTGSYVWRSGDGGKHWSLTAPSLRAVAPGGGDSHIAVGADGTLYMTDLWLGSSTVSVSHDKGQTWTANPLEGTPAQDRQWMAVTAGGNVYHVTHQIPVGIVVSRSLDGGNTFPLRTVAAPVTDQTGCVCPPGNMVAEGGGVTSLTDKVGVIFSTSSGGVSFTHSENSGATFTVTPIPQPQGTLDTHQNFPIVADAGNGQLGATWMVVQDSRTRVYFARSSDFGAHWSKPLLITGTGASAFPWITARGHSFGISMYHTSMTGMPGSLAGARWYVQALVSTNSGQTWGRPQTADPRPIKVGKICLSGINCSKDRELGDFQSVLFTAAGKLAITYDRSDGKQAVTYFVQQR
jgi:hypothetical protein